MFTTTWRDFSPTMALDGEPREDSDNSLLAPYLAIIREQQIDWTSHLQFIRQIGKGGQGVVFLSERRGADGFKLPLALKMFSPERFTNEVDYDLAMGRIARVAAHVAQIQHDNLLDVQNFIDLNRVRLMVMEWVDGYDLQRLLTAEMLFCIKARVSSKRWDYINRVLATAGPVQPRIKAGVAVAIVRDCLGALAALHREEIVHGDIKPSNIMLKRTGHAKIIDIGSAFEKHDPPPTRTCTPAYAAPEVLEGQPPTPRSDLASLGYVLIEMLAGRPVFAGMKNYRDLLEAKRRLPSSLADLVPVEVSRDDMLMNFCRGLIAPDPMLRFPSAEDADLRRGGAAAFQRHLVLSDLASEYDNEIRLWLQELKELDALSDVGDSTV